MGHSGIFSVFTILKDCGETKKKKKDPKETQEITEI